KAAEQLGVAGAPPAPSEGAPPSAAADQEAGGGRREAGDSQEAAGSSSPSPKPNAPSPTSVAVVDLRSLVPLDTDTILEWVKKTGRVVIAHEGPEFGGFGGEIAALIARE